MRNLAIIIAAMLSLSLPQAVAAQNHVFSTPSQTSKKSVDTGFRIEPIGVVCELELIKFEACLATALTLYLEDNSSEENNCLMVGVGNYGLQICGQTVIGNQLEENYVVAFTGVDPDTPDGNIFRAFGYRLREYSQTAKLYSMRASLGFIYSDQFVSQTRYIFENVTEGGMPSELSFWLLTEFVPFDIRHIRR